MTKAMRGVMRGLAIIVTSTEAKRSRERSGWEAGHRQEDRGLSEREVSESNLWN
jgi:hypothetical protein